MKNLIFFLLSAFLLISCNEDNIDPDNTFTSNFNNILFEEIEDKQTYVRFENDYVIFNWKSSWFVEPGCKKVPINGNINLDNLYFYWFKTSGLFTVTPIINKGDKLKLQFIDNTSQCDYYLEFVVKNSVLTVRKNDCGLIYSDDVYAITTEDLVCN